MFSMENKVKLSLNCFFYHFLSEALLRCVLVRACALNMVNTVLTPNAETPIICGLHTRALDKGVFDDN